QAVVAPPRTIARKLPFRLERPIAAGWERFGQPHPQRRRSRDLALVVRLGSRFLRVFGLRPVASKILRSGFTPGKLPSYVGLCSSAQAPPSRSYWAVASCPTHGRCERG